MDMLLSMTALAITTYSLILLHPSLRFGDTSVNGIEQAEWEATNLSSGDCNEEKRNMIWNRLPKCIPKNESIAIPFPPDPNVIQYFPNRIELPRCSGACYENGHLYQSCKANETELQDVPVILETISGQTTVEVCSTVKLEVHVSCSCGCGDIECNELQEFNERSCSCICKNSSVRGQCMAQYNKIWDENSCTCRCRQDQWKKCNTGYEYDGIYTCQCLPGQVINRASLGLIVTLVVVVVVLFVCVVALGIMFRKERKKNIQLHLQGKGLSLSQLKQEEEEKGLTDETSNDL